jgi:hypothetical protein
MKYKITNMVNADIIIEDLSIRLSGKGSSAIVDANTADKSKDLVASRKLVRVDKIREINMPIWPFVKSESKPEGTPPHTPDNTSDMDEIKLLLSSILLEIRSKQEPKSELKTIIVEKNSVIQGHSAIVSEPMFIPSRITPDEAETDIKLREGEVLKNDLNKGIETLKKLRAKVK